MAVPTIAVGKTIGPFNAAGDLESSLDVEYLATVGAGNTNWFITETLWMYSLVVQASAVHTTRSPSPLPWGLC